MSRALPKGVAPKAGLLRRLFPAYFGGEPHITRVGLLDSGELVLLDPTNHALVISQATVQAIRTTLSKANAPP